MNKVTGFRFIALEIEQVVIWGVEPVFEPGIQNAIFIL
jgi:hypothetical protein